MPASFFSQSAESVARAFGTDVQKGLSSFQVLEKQKQFGLNQLLEKKGKSVWQLFAEQFSDAVIWILIAAAVISGLIGDLIEAAVILALVVLNAALGVRQEFKAEKAMAALKKLSAPKATVIRDDVQQQISARELVPGDLVLIEAGDRIPA